MVYAPCGGSESPACFGSVGGGGPGRGAAAARASPPLFSTATPTRPAAYKLRVDGDDPGWGPPLPSVAVGASSDRATLSIDSRLDVILRPAEPVRKDVVLHSFCGKGPSVESWNVDLERSPSGVFHLRGRVRDLPPLSPGHWELFFVVGYPDFVPTKDKLVQLLNADPQEGPRPGWQLIRGEVDILPTRPLGNRAVFQFPARRNAMCSDTVYKRVCVYSGGQIGWRKSL